MLAAAGRGERLGLEQPKAFAPLRGRPLLAESLERLEASAWVEGIVVAAPPGWEEPTILLAEELGCGKVVACVRGASNRAESVRAALLEVPAEAAVVLVHDAARPLLSEDVIERVVSALGNAWDGVVPALPVPDTVKRVEDGRVTETLDRTGLVGVQTPQAFIASVLRQAFAAPPQSLVRAGDCASLVEAAGGRVGVVEGDRRLLKVTTLDDLGVVAAML